MSHNTFAIMIGDATAAEELIGIFKKIEKGTQSIWDSSFVKKTSHHLAWLTASAILFAPEKALIGGVASGAIIAASSWPKFLNHMAKDPKLRREFSELLDDGGGSLTARLYPRLAKFIYEDGHAIGVEKAEGKSALIQDMLSSEENEGEQAPAEAPQQQGPPSAQQAPQQAPQQPVPLPQGPQTPPTGPGGPQIR